MFFSCKKNEKEWVNEITIFGDTEFVSTKHNLVVYKSVSYFEPDILDSTKIYFSKSDWELINHSFSDNKINLFDSINHDIGVVAHTIEKPRKIIIKTNKRNIKINYEYFINDSSKINFDKTKRYKNFIKVFDSIIFFKMEKARK